MDMLGTSRQELRDEEISGMYLPVQVWGFDPCFQSFNKMYIEDVLSMPEYPTHKGSFAYKNHPIYKVDIQGIIVQLEQNRKCFLFGDIEEMKSELPQPLMKKVEELLVSSKPDGYDLGDCINVRGKIKIFREQREVVASHHYKVVDPMEGLARMAQLPTIYRRVLDKPYVLPDIVRLELEFESGLTGHRKTEEQVIYALKRAVSTYLNTEDKSEFCVSNILEREDAGTVLSKKTDEEKTYLVTKVLGMLEDSGIICQRCDKPLCYEVIKADSGITKKVIHILSKECQKIKYKEKGCHLLHVCDELKKTLQYSKVREAGVTKCLDMLVAQSDVIMTSHKHYLYLSF